MSCSALRTGPGLQDVLQKCELLLMMMMMMIMVAAILVMLKDLPLHRTMMSHCHRTLCVCGAVGVCVCVTKMPGDHLRRAQPGTRAPDTAKAHVKGVGESALSNKHSTDKGLEAGKGNQDNWVDTGK